MYLQPRVRSFPQAIDRPRRRPEIRPRDYATLLMPPRSEHKGPADNYPSSSVPRPDRSMLCALTFDREFRLLAETNPLPLEIARQDPVPSPQFARLARQKVMRFFS